MEPQQHDAGHQRKARPHAGGAAEDKQDQRHQVGDDGAVKVGVDPEDKREKHEHQREQHHRLPQHQKPQETSEGGGDALAALEVVPEGEGVAQHGSGQHRGQTQRSQLQTAGIAAVEENRQKALAQVAQEGHRPAPEAAVLKGVGGAGVAVLAGVKHSALPKAPGGQPGEQDAAGEISGHDIEQSDGHGIFTSRGDFRIQSV